MKKTGFLKRNSTLKAYTPLKAKTGLKKTGYRMKSTGFSADSAPTHQFTLDRLFSEYVRRIHADFNGAVQCVTCGIYRRWNDRMDAGHFIPRQHMATRYDIYNVFCQCRECNRELAGNITMFSEYITKVFGENAVQELKERAQTIIHDFPYEEKIKEFRLKVEKLREEQDINIQF
jgi:hypothetical protein